MTTTKRTITHEQIRALGNSAAEAGDLLMHAICEIAVGNDSYTDPSWLNDNTCLDASERAELAAMDREAATAACVAAVNAAEGQS